MSESLQKIERKQYAPELKAEAVSLVLEHGYSCGAAGQKLGVPAKTLANWVRPRRRQEHLKRIAMGVDNDDPAALRAQVLELQKQLRRMLAHWRPWPTGGAARNGEIYFRVGKKDREGHYSCGVADVCPRSNRLTRLGDSHATKKHLATRGVAVDFSSDASAGRAGRLAARAVPITS